MKNSKIRFIEPQLHRIIKESVKRTLKEEVSREELHAFLSPYREIFNDSICDKLEADILRMMNKHGVDDVKRINKDWIDYQVFDNAKNCLWSILNRPINVKLT